MTNLALYTLCHPGTKEEGCHKQSQVRSKGKWAVCEEFVWRSVLAGCVPAQPGAGQGVGAAPDTGHLFLDRARPAPAGTSSCRWAELGRVSFQAGQGCGEMETSNRDWSLGGWNGSWAMAGWGRPLRKCIRDGQCRYKLRPSVISSLHALLLGQHCPLWRGSVGSLQTGWCSGVN